VLRQPLPDEESMSGNAMLISVTNLTETIPLQSIVQRGKSFPKPDFYTLAKAKSELQWTFPVEEEPVAKFLASFIKENCAYDAELTRQFAAQTTNKIWLAAHYEPGEIIAKRGDVITAATKAALDQLQPVKPSPETHLPFATENSRRGIIVWIVIGL